MKFPIIYRLALPVVALASAALMSSCEDFLDVEPKSSFTPREIFSSENESRAMMNSIYSKLTSDRLYGYAWPYEFNTNSDVELEVASTPNSTSGNGDDAHCFDVRPIWASLRNTWNNAYEVVNYCNDFIANMEGSPLFSTTVGANGPTEAQQMYGEVKCIRALVFLDLIRTWGDVVWRDRPTEASETLYSEGTTDRDVIFERLIADLKETEHYMKYASQMDDGVTRASREYCQALIGQLALYRGGWSLRPGGANGIMERGDNYEEYYKIAEEYLGKVITEGRHSLDRESFKAMWYGENNWSVLKDGDVIFEIPMRKERSSYLGYRVGVTIGYNEDNPKHSFGSARNYTNFSGLYPFTFDVRDQRLDVTCVPYNYDEDLNQTHALGKTAVAGWNIGKWNKLEMGTPMVGTGGNTGINAIRMRYADVLLMYAEVVNELHGPVDAAKNALKAVRRRAFLPEDQAEMVDGYVAALTSPEAFFEAIVSERAWEFGGEGVRKYDLARWNRYSSTIINIYNKYIDWGKRAQGQGIAGDVRPEVYVREVEDAANPGRKVLEFKGLKEYGDNIGDHNVSDGWRTVVKYASNWWDRNKETDEWECCDDIKYSFRGFLNINNAGSVQPTDAIRYLMPYPDVVITSHRGSIQQQYGYQ